MSLVRMYGLRIRCAIALPGEPVADEGAAEVEVHLRALPPGAEKFPEHGAPLVHLSEHAPGETPSLIVDRPSGDAMLRLRYAEGIRFHVSAAGDAVWCDWTSPLTEADVATFLVGPVMGSVLRRRGVIALHASAVEMQGGAWAFLGPGGSGKSTLAAALARAGHPVITEDVLALRPEGDAWLAVPGYCAIRLWDDSAALVDGGAELPALTPTWPKRDLDLKRRTLPFASGPLPLKGVLVLDDLVPEGEAPHVVPMSASALLVELVANSYANYAASPDELARELVALARIAPLVRAWRFAPSAGIGGLSQCCSLLESLVNR